MTLSDLKSNDDPNYPKWRRKKQEDDWWPPYKKEQDEWPIPPNPRNQEISCPSCGGNSGYTQDDIAYLVIPSEGLMCKRCGHRFLKPMRYWL